MTDKTLFKKRQGYLWVASAVASLDTADSVLAQLITPLDITSWAEDVTVAYPEGSIEKVDFHGEDANGFQNQSLEEQSWGMAKMTGTLVFSPINTDASIAAYMSATGTAITSGEVRYQFGSSAVSYLRGSKAIVFGFGAARTLCSGAYDGGTTLTVDSTAGFPNSGSLIVGTDTSVTYTGKTSTTFTEVSGGSAQDDDALVQSTGTTVILTMLNNAKFTKLGDVAISGNRYRIPFEATCLTADFYEDVQAA